MNYFLSLLLSIPSWFFSLEKPSQSSSPLLKNIPSSHTLHYLALGDSYTIGTAIGKENSYASLLAQSLAAADVVDSVYLKIIAKNGWTTQDLLKGIKKEKQDSNFHLVSVLIGVNNQYQNLSLKEYKKEVTQVLSQAIAFAQGEKERVLVLSIPDWGSTPAGLEKRSIIAAQIDLFNQVKKGVCDSLGLTYVDVTTISRKAAMQPLLVAKDNLHFSAQMHGLWLKHVLSKIELINLLPE